MAGPIKTWRNKGIEVAAWEGKWGKQFTWRKTYKDKQSGEYKEAKFLFEDDVLKLSELLAEAYGWAKSGENREAETTSQLVQQIVKDVVANLDDDIPF